MTSLLLGGIVLAAGASRRMGTAKSFISIEGRTFVEHAVALLKSAPCEELVVVCPPSQSARYRAVIGDGGRLVENPAPNRGMLSSLAIGMDALSGSVTHAMVTLVDTPLISTETAVLLVGQMRKTPDRIIVPCHANQPGHPVIYPRSLWAPLVGWSGPEGARGFMAARADLTLPMEVPDEAILQDFDTPEDLSRVGKDE